MKWLPEWRALAARPGVELTDADFESAVNWG